MNKTLIIYDNKGVIVSQITGNYEIPNGLPYIEIEIPKNKYPKSVNIETKKVIYENMPKTEIETLNDKISILEQNNQELRKELNQIQTSIAALITTTIEK